MVTGTQQKSPSPKVRGFLYIIFERDFLSRADGFDDVSMKYIIKLTHHQIIKSTSLRRTLVLTVLYSAMASLQPGSLQCSQVLGQPAAACCALVQECDATRMP